MRPNKKPETGLDWKVAYCSSVMGELGLRRRVYEHPLSLDSEVSQEEFEK